MKKTLLLLMMCALLPRVAEAQTPTDDTFTVSDLTFDEEITWNDDENEGAYYFTISLDGVEVIDRDESVIEMIDEVEGDDYSPIYNLAMH